MQNTHHKQSIRKTMNSDRDTLVLIKGAGDLASGVAFRLHRCGFPVIMTELPQPLMVRRKVSFGEAVYEGEIMVEGVIARLAADIAEARMALTAGVIPVLVDPEAACRETLTPPVLVDAIVAKSNTGTRISDAPLVIALGPGFTAGIDCHAVIETQRGHWLGRVIHQGSAQADSGEPGEIGGQRTSRILRAPVGGIMEAQATIGERVTTGQPIATVAGLAVTAGCEGTLRGLIRSGLPVTAGLKIGDIDPRAVPAHCYTISDKALSVGGGVLEAILSVLSR
jgi:xanthine dehydrogenase accessory factor